MGTQTKLGPLIYPTRSDPRWFILAFLGCFMIYAVSSPGFQRYPVQFVTVIAICTLLDAALCRWYQGVNLFPMSGIVTSGGTLLLTDSPYVWPYAFVAVTSILSKHFIRVDDRHVFNPNNFGIVLGTLFFSTDISIVAARWGGSTEGFILIFCLGCLVAWRGGRLDLALTYVAAFFLGALLRSYYYAAPLHRLLTPMTGAGFMLFTFYMITDPMTTPSSRRDRIIFGALLGLLDNWLRQNQIPNAPFYVLFAMTGVLSAWKASAMKSKREDIWKFRAATT